MWEQAEADYMSGMKYKDIAVKYNVSLSTVKSWKTRYKWNRKSTRRKNEKVCVQNEKGMHAPKKPGGQPGNKNAIGSHGEGNQNAVGNNGGAPRHNKNAVTTGQHETIWMDCLSEKEQALLGQVDTDEMVQVEQSILALSIMEYRMFERLRKLMDGVTEKERRIVSQCQKKGEIVFVSDEVSGEKKMVYRDKPELVITEITETEFRKIDDILKQEKALLDVQGRKGRQVELKHKLQMEQEKLQLERKRIEIMAMRAGDFGGGEEIEDTDSYYEALKGQLGRVWSDDS